MAISTKGILGPFSGKIGNVVGSSINGRHYIKSLPKKRTKPWSEKQLAQQVRFAVAVSFLSSIKALLKHNYPKSNKGASGYNLALKYILQQAITGTYPEYTINYPEVQLARGPVANVGALQQYYRDESLVISWDPGSDYVLRLSDDRVMILVYDPDSQTYIEGAANLIRANGGATIAIAEHYHGKTLHTYLYCISRQGKRSFTTYAGPVDCF